MSTTYEILASQLPLKLRGGFGDDEILNITISTKEDVQLKESLIEAKESIKRGEGFVTRTAQEVGLMISNIKSSVDAKHKKDSA